MSRPFTPAKKFWGALAGLLLFSSAPSFPQPVKDVEMDCKGVLQDPDSRKEQPVSAHVQIFAGQVIAHIEPHGLVQGPITKTEENHIHFGVQLSSFTIDGLNPTKGVIDRVNASVSIFMGGGSRGYVFWLDCVVRKPQF